VKVEDNLQQTLFIYDILDESFREKLSRTNSDRLKKIGLIRAGSQPGSRYIWRSKALKAFEEGGRVGPIDSGKGRKSNWHVPFFGYSNTDDLSNTTKETLRVACFLCTNLTSVQCVQSTMQRHLLLKHDSIAKCLTETTTSAKCEAYWHNVQLQAQLLLSNLAPLAYMDSMAFRNYSIGINPAYIPYYGSRLVRVVAQNCYVPSLIMLQNELRMQASGLSRSLVITLDIVSNAGKQYAGVSVTLINSKWEHSSYFLSMMPMDERFNGKDVAIGIDMMLTEMFSIPRHFLLAVLAKPTPDCVACANGLGVPLVSCMSADVDDVALYALGLKTGSPEGATAIRTALTKANNVVGAIRRSPSVLRAYRALGGNPRVVLQPTPDSSPSASLWKQSLGNVKSVLDSTTCLVELFRRISPSDPSLPDTSSSLEIETTDLQLLRTNAPVFSDWAVWATLLTALSPLQLQYFFLGDSPSPPLSLLLYLVDLLVFSCDNTELLSPEVAASDQFDQSQYQAVVEARHTLSSSLKERYLGPSMKLERRGQYECMCKSTLLDPRTKDFLFFVSSEMALQVQTGVDSHMDKRRRSQTAQALYEDAALLVLAEMVYDVTEMVSQDERGEAFPALQKPVLLNVLRSVRYPNRAMEHHLLKTQEIHSGFDPSLAAAGHKRKAPGGPEGGPSPMDSDDDRRRRIEAACRAELSRYCGCEPPCAASEISKTDSLAWWARNEETYPILAQVARRYVAIRSMVAANDKVLRIATALHGKERRNMSPGLVDAIVFLFMNGTLDTTIPDDLMNSGNVQMANM